MSHRPEVSISRSNYLHLDMRAAAWERLPQTGGVDLLEQMPELAEEQEELEQPPELALRDLAVGGGVRRAECHHLYIG